MKTYAGIDLHSSNNYIGVIDAKDKRLYSLEIVFHICIYFFSNLRASLTSSSSALVVSSGSGLGW